MYVDDIIIKSREGSDHLTHLRKFFDRLHRYNLKLNPAKCTFGVPAGKLLGFIVSRIDIELDPSKIKAIQELPHPKTTKEVMSFLGRLNYISRFIVQSTVVCESIFKLLKNDVLTKWTGECQTVFDTIKNYFSNPPVLVPPREGSPLLLYIFVSNNALRFIFGQHDKTGKKERVIYYLSKKFTLYEDGPIEVYFLQKAMPTGKLAKWKMLMSEFDIVYVTQKAIKAQALVDHIVENPVDEEYERLKTYFPDEEVAFVGENISEPYPGWRVFFDGAINHQCRGIGAVLVSETGQNYHMAAKLRFDCTNSMVEYEVCIIGLKIAINVNVHELWTPDLGLLRCIDTSEAAKLLEQIHAGVSGTHMNGVTLVHGDLICVLPHELNDMSSSWPFVAWGMDVIGPIEPATSNGHRFILVAIDYLTKWVEVASYKLVTKKVVADFVRNNLLCRFGVPESIIIDNGANINNHLMKELCEQLKITHRNSTAYRPKRMA
ncbi:uncharacterized protein LOC125847050 [Solanum stenotomum]|uniref:uncharacterized protein LOC125847050 n=1 Tax=Solanum stenotomum TaxID=172797 RepID=UPI0020D002E7|nr:uncharacterized protein LOC125847050 [Solanum stenotomum]